MRRLALITFVLLVAFSTWANADTEETTTFSIEANEVKALGERNYALNAGLGFVNYYNQGEGKYETILKINATPVLRAGPLSAGLGVNYLVTSKDKRRELGETGKNPVILRFVQYEKKPWQARWGILEGVSLANGLIMAGYTTASTQESSVFTNKDKGGLLAYSGSSGITALGTQSHLYAGRVYHRFSSFTLGCSYAQDSDEKDDVTAYGADLKIPLTSKFALCLEGAKVKVGDGSKIDGKGFSAAANLSLGKLAWGNQYVNFDEKFLPGIFNAHYEIDSQARKVGGAWLDGVAPPAGKKKGFISQLTLIPIEQLRLSATYKDYEGYQPCLIGEATFGLGGKEGEGYFGNLTGRLSYEQRNFRILETTSKDAVITAEVATSVSKNTDIIVRYKKVYTETGKPVSTINYEYKLKF
ncbi:MAG: hypothetical protein COS84_01880 [Armatimonadetes bacterium CG07_land_8_20_14_0_80_40_9]|nr:MAG: hypothetical protein COS84_01880 [Armatimonadetes bacterium CG07_land_8_20_14_0_80_40_9]